MGLDVSFIKREQVGSFRKINFFLTYFDINDELNTECVKIEKDVFERFVNDLKTELASYEEKLSKQVVVPNDMEIPPDNEKLRTKEVSFGGSTKYDSEYWADLAYVYNWARELLNSFDWDDLETDLFIVCWW